MPLSGKQGGPVFPEGVQIRDEGTDDLKHWRYRVTIDARRAWAVEVGQMGAYYSPRIAGQNVAGKKQRVYATREFASSAAMREIEKVEAQYSS